MTLKRCKKFDANDNPYYFPPLFLHILLPLFIEFPEHVIAESYLVIESPIRIGKEKFTCL